MVAGQLLNLQGTGSANFLYSVQQAEEMQELSETSLFSDNLEFLHCKQFCQTCNYKQIRIFKILFTKVTAKYHFAAHYKFLIIFSSGLRVLCD